MNSQELLKQAVNIKAMAALVADSAQSLATVTAHELDEFTVRVRRSALDGAIEMLLKSIEEYRNA